MNAKRIAALMMALWMACVGAGALAENDRFTYEDVYITSCGYSDRVIFSRDGVEYLALPDGTPVSAEYDSIQEVSRLPLYTVKALEPKDNNRCEGVIDAQGQVLVPPEYMDTKVISERWALGFQTVTCEEKDADYYITYYVSGRKLYFQIDTVDVYYRGQLVGALTRSEYNDAGAYGDTLVVENRQGKYTFYNKALEKSPYSAKGYNSGEYDRVMAEEDEYVFIHQGTGQRAFCEGCTLTPDEVEDCYAVDEGVVYNLQGPVLVLQKQYDSIEDLLSTRYAEVQLDGLYGVVDVLTGEEVIPLEYEGLECYVEEQTQVCYALAKKDGKVGYVRQGGQVTCPFEYSADRLWDYNLFVQISAPEGGYVVLSALAGILPETYQDVDIQDNACAFVATNAEGQQAVIGLNGQTLIPFGDYQLQVNAAATVATGRNSEDVSFVWVLDGADALRMPAEEQ